MSAIPAFSAPRTWGVKRIGPHNKPVLDILVSGMLGDWWSNLVPSKTTPSVRFEIEQAESNEQYLQDLANTLYYHGYVANPILKKHLKSEGSMDRRKDSSVDRFNYRLTTFTFSSLAWIHNDFYPEGTKIVPRWVTMYLSPLGLAHWIMQDGSRQQGQGISLATNSFTHDDCVFLASFLTSCYGLKTSVVKTGVQDQWRISVWKQSMPLLAKIVGPHMHPAMSRKISGYL